MLTHLNSQLFLCLTDRVHFKKFMVHYFWYFNIIGLAHFSLFQPVGTIVTSHRRIRGNSYIKETFWNIFLYVLLYLLCILGVSVSPSEALT